MMGALFVTSCRLGEVGLGDFAASGEGFARVHRSPGSLRESDLPPAGGGFR